MTTPVNVGSSPNDGTGDTLRAAFLKVNANTAEIEADVDGVVTDLAALDSATASAVTALQGADSSLDSRIDALEASDTLQGSNITANAGAITTLQSTTGTHTTQIAALVSADLALDGRLDTLEASDTSQGSAITANSGAITTLQGTTGTHTTQIAALQSADTALAAADTALGLQVTALEVPRTRFARVTVDQTLIGTSYADVTGLSFSMEANTTYEFEFILYADSDATTTGIDVAVNGPASPASLNYVQGRYSTTQFYLETVATAYDNDTASTGVATTATRVFRVKGVVANGVNAGDLRARIKREAVGTGPNVRAGSFGIIRKLF